MNEEKNMYDTEVTDEQREQIIKEGNEFIECLKKDTEGISNVINYPTDDSEDLPVKNMEVMVDPNTGEHKILGSTEEEQDSSELKDSFDEMVKKINENDDVSLMDDSPITEQEAVDYLSSSTGSESILNELSKGTDYTPETIRDLLIVTNRRINKEQFNVYKELPEQIKKMIDTYVTQGIGTGNIGATNIATINSIKHNVAEALIDEFINDIQFDRSKNDFARDLETIYQSSAKEITDASLEYIDERNKAYREAANEMEDPEKKARLLAILDQIDEARSLTTLKEFAKRCKIKSIELEKPESRVYRGFLNKYINSTNNIYDIKVARTVLFRHLSNEGYTMRDVDAFLIAFCKQVDKYSPTVATEHAYMYYVLYYSALLDGDRSTTFINNVKDVIVNLKERNSIINK